MNTKIAVLAFIILLSFNSSFGQKITGQYYGIGSVSKDGNFSQYLSELILNQNGNKVEGEYNYYFKSSYIPSRVSGFYNNETRVLELQVFPLLNYKAANNLGADCPMKGFFTLKVSRVETVLSGQFEPSDHFKYTCPDIVLKLKKEILTPEQKKKLDKRKAEDNLADNNDEVDDTNETVAKNVITAERKSTFNRSPVQKDEIKNIKQSGKDDEQTSTTKAVAQVKNVAQMQPSPIEKTVQAATMPIIKTASSSVASRPETSSAIIKRDTIPVTASVGKLPLTKPNKEEELTHNLTKRTFEKSPVIEVEADSLYIALYDNGEIDDDTVALFHNRKLVVSGQRLSDKAINITIPIDTAVHEISMYAENLGRIPPNTAICVIMAGNKRYELALSSNYILNGTIRFRKNIAFDRQENEKISR